MSEQHENAIVPASRLPWAPAFEHRFGIRPNSWRSLVEDVWPNATTVEGILRGWQICQDEGLDPYARVVHVVPLWSPKQRRLVDHIWYGIGFLRTVAFRTREYAGADPVVYGDSSEHTWQDFEWQDRQKVKTGEITMEYPVSAQQTVYRLVDGQRFPFPGPVVRFFEAYTAKSGGDIPNDRWQRAPWQMLGKCAEAAALRMAFPECGSRYIEEEMNGYAPERQPLDVTPPSPPPPQPQDFAATPAPPPPPTPTPSPSSTPTSTLTPSPTPPPTSTPTPPLIELVDMEGVITLYENPAEAYTELTEILFAAAKVGQGSLDGVWESNDSAREKLNQLNPQDLHLENTSTVAETLQQLYDDLSSPAPPPAPTSSPTPSSPPTSAPSSPLSPMSSSPPSPAPPPTSPLSPTSSPTPPRRRGRPPRNPPAQPEPPGYIVNVPDAFDLTSPPPSSAPTPSSLPPLTSTPPSTPAPTLAPTPPSTPTSRKEDDDSDTVFPRGSLSPPTYYTRVLNYLRARKTEGWPPEKYTKFRENNADDLAVIDKAMGHWSQAIEDYLKGGEGKK